MAAKKLKDKDPDEVLDYDLKWSDILDGDAIIDSFVIVESGDVVVDSQDYLDGVQKIWLSGGTLGTTSVLTARIDTRDGRRHDRQVRIRIRTK